ncbi:unnamed protein product [Adineta steineri]|uniref:Uncharacterized protein n=1 Tax=Adineta steineri TaxID=433720 RepID=A0A813V2M9_9BILA|nr:unnamed protein product [Adineta steineri]
MKPSIDFVTVIAARPTESYTGEIKKIKEEVWQITDHIEEYASVDECESFVRSARYKYIFIIVTVDLINDLFSLNIHQFRQVQSIFLFDPYKNSNPLHINDLRKLSYKMQEVYISSSDLIRRVEKCVHECANKSDILLSSLAGCSSDTMTTNVVNNIADFAELWFPLYIDFLFELPMVDSKEEKLRFIEQCRRHFAQNSGALQLIAEFEEHYGPHGALYYYTCDGFFYRIVNRALRRQAIECIRDFRFFLLDIRNQLQLAHEKFLHNDTKVGMSKTFFRGQLMSDAELEELQKKHREGTLITTNSYLSTSECVETARIFAGKPTNGIVSILFEITAEIKDPQIKQRKPFARIGHLSTFGDVEREVLFSIGSFFKIDQIDEESSSCWIVKMTFVDEDDQNQIVTSDFRILRTCSLEMKSHGRSLKIGDLLAKHSQQGISKARRFYDLIKTSNSSDALKAACDAGLGWLALNEENVSLAIEQQQKALGLYEKLKPEGDSESLTHLYITSYNCIGACFRQLKEYRPALKYYRKAEKLALKVPIDKYAMYEGYRNITSINIALTHKLLGNIDQTWELYKKILAYEMNTSTHFHGPTYLTIAQAGLHEAQVANNVHEYEQHFQHWKAFLDLSLTNMSSSYRRSIISGVLVIGFQYADNHQTQTMAMDYFQKVIRISRRYINVNRDDYRIVLDCLNQLARLNTKRQQYAHSMNHAMEALNMCREDDLGGIVECYKSIASNYEQQLLDQEKDLTPDDIHRMIIDNPFTNVIETAVQV